MIRSNLWDEHKLFPTILKLLLGELFNKLYSCLPHQINNFRKFWIGSKYSNNKFLLNIFVMKNVNQKLRRFLSYCEICLIWKSCKAHSSISMLQNKMKVHFLMLAAMVISCQAKHFLIQLGKFSSFGNMVQIYIFNFSFSFKFPFKNPIWILSFWALPHLEVNIIYYLLKAPFES